MEQRIYDQYLKILEHELVPALGCTEPIALAYCAAKAREVLGVFPDRILLTCSGNIIKNVKGVTVPNSGGLRGIEAAAILGLVGGNPEKELEVLESVVEEDISETRRLMEDGFCTVSLAEDVENLYIVAKVFSGEDFAQVTIVNRHTLITEILKNDEVLYRHGVLETSPDYVDKSLLNIESIVEFANIVDVSQLESTIGKQILLNSAISQEGLSGTYGAEVGRTLLEVYGHDVKVRARAKAAAGSDARMGGCSLPVVINSGSGNQGMTVSLPVMEFALELGASRELLFRALVVSNLVSIHQKKYIGSLSAYCGAVSAGCGAGAGITYLHGGTVEQIGLTIVNTIGNVGGILCDGAKSSCAAKISSSVEAGIMGHYMSMKHHSFLAGEGIVQEDIEDTIRSIGYIGRVGMRMTDQSILHIMLDGVEE